MLGYAVLQDFSSTYLRLDCANDPLTGPLETQEVYPDGNLTRDLGNSTNSWRQLYARRTDLIDNSGGNATRNGAGLNSVIGGRLFGYGTNTIRLGGPTFPGLGIFGNVYTYTANNIATMDNQGGGSFMVGSAFAYRGTDQALIEIGNASFGSFCGGYSYPYFGSSAATCSLDNNGSGSFVWGYPATTGSATGIIRTQTNARGAFVAGRTTGYGDATIEALNAGAFVQGIIDSQALTNSGRLRARGNGAFVQGAINHSAGGSFTELDAQGAGSFVQGNAAARGRMNSTNVATGGFVQGFVTGTGSLLQVSQVGALARGRATGGGTIVGSGAGAFAAGSANAYDIIASNTGAFAMGDAVGGNITASGQGAFAFGDADSYNILASAAGAMAFGLADTANIEATAGNAVQIGPGTNATADSVQIGTGIQMGQIDGNLRFDGRLDGNTRLVTTTTATAGNEFAILCDDDTAGGAITITLPAANVADTMYNIKKLGTTGNVIIDGNGSETIDGALTQTITAQYSSRTLISDGTTWHILTAQGA